MQKEFARIHGTKEAGAITYYINYYADPSITGYVKKESFIPSPKVESAIVRINKLKKARVNVKDEELLFRLIKENFTQRRKSITNSLSRTIEKNKLLEILKEVGIDTKTRGEALTLEQFASICDLASK